MNKMILEVDQKSFGILFELANGFSFIRIGKFYLLGFVRIAKNWRIQVSSTSLFFKFICNK